MGWGASDLCRQALVGSGRVWRLGMAVWFLSASTAAFQHIHKYVATAWLQTVVPCCLVSNASLLLPRGVW